MSLITRTDVTAVKFYKNLILAGVGSTIYVYSKDSAKFLYRLLVLNGHKIYGFIPSECDKKILVFGGKQFTVISATLTEDLLCRLFNPIVCDDWLHSSVWIDNDIVAVLTAHNVVEKWDTRTQRRLSQHLSKDNSILYSGLLLPIKDDVLVMAGTVYSEVIIHNCCDLKPLHNLKGHKGVIFSISCKPENHIIVTTSDDRSVRIWGPNVVPTAPYIILNYWKSSIVCKHEVYGHLARVMRSCITNDLIVSVGEDSAICYWNYEGRLLRKAVTHQNGCIWSVDTDSDNLVTGGGDCGVIVHPLSIAKEYSRNAVIDIGVTTPRKAEFTARRNLVIIDENNLIYYDFANKISTVELKHNSTYKLLSLSSCKQLVAIADMTGKLDVFVENCKDDATLTNLIDTELNIGKVLSMNWAGNRHLVFCIDNGIIIVCASNVKSIDKYATFVLPRCKEALLTAAAVDHSNKYFVLGDRCGNIHIFVKEQRDPVKSFTKVHGRYGPRSLLFKGKNIISTGRDHNIKYFSCDDGSFKLMSIKDLPFAWVEKFLDNDQNIVCGFQERMFVVYNIKDNSKILEIPCGGGHRSFDAVRYIDNVNDKYDEVVKLVYLKDSDINVVTFELSKIASKNIINGSHSKEINCLKSHKVKDITTYISGGEDTTLRISSIDAAMNFEDKVCFKNLSSVRTLKTYFIDDNNFLLISAGGRAQICVKKVKLAVENNKMEVISEEVIDYLIKGTDKQRKGNRSWSNCTVDIDPEMRIMDIDLLRDNNNFIVYAGCSDASLRIFSFNCESKNFTLLNKLNCHRTCILKIKLIEMFNNNVLISCTTTGDVTFWDVTDIVKSNITPYFSIKTNKSGINSIVFANIDDNRAIIGTAGDDNAIHIVLLQIMDKHNLSSMEVLNSWSCSNYHSSQITGLCLVDNYILSASIDQRLTLLKWELKEEIIECQFLSQTFTDVSDVQGMDLIEYDSDTMTVCVFGKGLEVIVIPKNK